MRIISTGMDRQQKWIKEPSSTFAIICFMGNNKNMILNNEFGSMKMHKASLFFSVFKIKSIDFITSFYLFLSVLTPLKS